MTVLIKHSKVSTIPDTDDTSLVRPSDWNADHVVVGAAESGANSDITSLSGITGGISSPDYIQFDTAYNTPLTEGQLGWDGNDTLAVGMAGGNVIQHIGEDQFIYIKADAAITKGQVIMFTGAVGASGVLTGAPATGVTNSQYIMGIAAEDLAQNAFGLVQTFGELTGINTNSFNEGDVLYYDSAVTGGLTNIFPASGPIVLVAAVAKKSGGNGTLVVRVSVTQRITEGTGATITQSSTGTTVAVTNPYNPAAVAITGGTINGTTIGATTPSTGTFTTITGQTEVLRGTGQNLLLQSNTFNTTWSATNATLTGSQSDPFGGSTAFLVTATSTAAVGVGQSPALASQTYTFSVYAKAGTSTWLRLFGPFPSTSFAWFNLSTGVLGTVNTGLTATITPAGSGWYRCAITGIGNGPVGIRLADADNNTSATNGTALTIYGAQLEVASSVGTYIPTTTTAVYGTPTLSFSGVSEIGLQSNGALYLQPAGTGAIQAQATTSTSAGGNNRGANAVDWQTVRTSAGQVASATASVISGGTNHTNSGTYSFVGGGFQNTSSANGAGIVSGSTNSATGQFALVGAGVLNTASGFYGFVGNGYRNSTTSSSAVTTQSGTMNGTTAVTLSGANANIRVGQLITGTSIANDTYVAAISGTSLTLSQNASGSSTSTLSFFTPHGVVVGGGNNQATGAYSFIGGGGDAGTAANRNVASGDWSVVAGGWKNVASGIYSTAVGGTNNTASGQGAFIGGGGWFGSGVSANTASGTSSFVGAGYGNSATGFCSSVLGGVSNTANQNFNSVIGGTNAIARSIVGYTVFPANGNPLNSNQGATQTALLVLARQTTDATATVLTSDTAAAGTTNQVILPNNSAYYFKIEVIAGKTAAGDSKAVELKGAIKRGANAASTTLIGSVTSTVIAEDAGASAWTAVATADTTNGGIKLTVTGQASTTIRWVARCTTTEMTF